MESVSIVIPIYKPNRQYLEELFLSILQQQFQDFDVILSDDGDDESLINQVIPKELSTRVRYTKNVGNHGIFGNLNNGIINANGKYIQIFCQDDIMLPTLIGNNYDSLEEHSDAGLVFSNFHFISDHGEKSKFQSKVINFIPTRINSTTANNYFLYFGCIPGNLSPVMMRKSLFDEVGLFNDECMYAGDFEFWVRAAKYSNIYFSKEFHLHVRIHKGRASTTLGSFKCYNEIKHIFHYLINHNNIPTDTETLRKFIHIGVFRSVSSFAVRRIFRMRQSEWHEMIQIFDGKPYSLSTAIIAYFYPRTRKINRLIQYMEKQQYD